MLRHWQDQLPLIYLTTTRIREDKLIELESVIGNEANPIFTYIRSIRELHSLCTSRTIDEYQQALGNFKKNFEFLFYNFDLNMTLKTHIVYHHYEDYFSWTGKSLRYTNGEFFAVGFF